MLSPLLQHSFAIFAVLVVIACVLQGVWLHYVRHAELPYLVWALAATLVLVTMFLADQAGEQEERRVQQNTQYFARLYASEMEQHQHASLRLDTPPDDPHYLELIEIEKRWLSINKIVNDIYTFRKRPDGKNVLMVDSETDYDHNGVIEGEREQRTPLGEVYKVYDVGLEDAFKGRAAFTSQPMADRWGTWVSAFVPMHDLSTGKVEGVLGVDFSAEVMMQAVAVARLRLIYQMAFLQVVLLGSSTLNASLRAETRERQRSLEALHISEQHFRQVVQALPIALYTCNAQGRITLYNKAAAELWGREPDLEREHWSGAWKMFRLDQSIVEATGSPVALALQSGEPLRDEEIVFERPDGHRVYAISYAEPIRDARGHVFGALNILVDLTARREADLRLADLNRQLQHVSREAGMAEVATSVLHNVGNVLNSANISIEMAAGKIRSLRTETLSRLAALLQENAADLPGFLQGNPQGQQLPAFVGQLATHFATEKGHLAEELASLGKHLEHINEIIARQQGYASRREVLETLPLQEIIDDALHLNGASLDRHGAEVVRELDVSVPIFPVDRHKLIQILVNLIQNAKQAMDEGPATSPKRLTLRTTRLPADRVRVEISDTGIGILPENLARVFEHGFTTRREGHGFGLHASALAAREMGGTLTVVSPGPGLGATFTLELPLTPRLS